MGAAPTSHMTLDGALVLVFWASHFRVNARHVSGVLFCSSGGTRLCSGLLSEVSEVCTVWALRELCLSLHSLAASCALVGKEISGNAKNDTADLSRLFAQTHVIV